MFSNSQQLVTEYKELFLQNKQNELISTLNRCGKFVTTNFYCKQCEDDGREALLEFRRNEFLCKIRYCKNPNCASSRFSDLAENIKSIQDFSGLKTLWHFSIGFESISLYEFKNNFSKHKKKYEYIIQQFFNKLKKRDIKLKGIRVLDISFTSIENGLVYPHFHFAVVPVNRYKRKEVMLNLQDVRRKILIKQRKKIPFHLQIFKHAEKKSVISYFAIRSSGMYKYDDNHDIEKEDKNFEPCKLTDSIKQNKFFFLQDLLTIKEYVLHFYKKRNYVAFGGCSYGSSIVDNSFDKMPKYCKFHGELEPNQIRIEVVFEDDIAPPPNTTIKSNSEDFHVFEYMPHEKIYNEY